VSNRRAAIEFKIRCAIVRTLLASRTQAQPAWTYKALKRQLETHGIRCSAASVHRYVLAVRGRGARYARGDAW
jgi:hypothetical protein